MIVRGDRRRRDSGTAPSSTSSLTPGRSSALGRRDLLGGDGAQVRVRHLLHQRGMAPGAGRRRRRRRRPSAAARAARSRLDRARGRGHAGHDTAIATQPLEDLRHGGPATDQVRGAARDEGGRRQQRAAARRRPRRAPRTHGLRDAQLHHAVRIRRRGAGQAVRRPRTRRPGGSHPGRLARCGPRRSPRHAARASSAALLFRGAAAARGPEPVERMRQAHQAALLVDGGGRLRRPTCRAARRARGTGR